MFRKTVIVILGIFLLLHSTGCMVEVERERPDSAMEQEEPVRAEDFNEPIPLEVLEEESEERIEEKEEIVIPVWELNEEDLALYMENQYGDRTVRTFGENIEGVYTSIDTKHKIAALTFDACGGVYGGGYDEELINYLIEKRIPATLFITGRWIEENEEIMSMLAQNDLFEIENHGYMHRPLSVDGRSAYGIKGTEGIRDVLDEIMKNQNMISEFTGRSPRYFRSGTAHYDDIALDILSELNLKAVNFDILGDAGATFNKEQMIYSAQSAKNGSIFLYHMNQPHKEIAEGIKHVIPMLTARGYSFVKLSEYDKYLK